MRNEANVCGRPQRRLASLLSGLIQQVSPLQGKHGANRRRSESQLGLIQAELTNCGTLLLSVKPMQRVAEFRSRRLRAEPRGNFRTAARLKGYGTAPALSRLACTESSTASRPSPGSRGPLLRSPREIVNRVLSSLSPSGLLDRHWRLQRLPSLY